MQRSRRCRSDEGAVLVEFAVLAPFLFLIVFGIIEFGWGFAQYLDVRHGAREAARLAAVNYSDDGLTTGAPQTAQIKDEACDRMGGDAIDATVELGLDSPGANELGDKGFIEVQSDLDTLTGFLDPLIGGISIDDEISFRLERDVDWSATEGALPC
jgi:Flp pilus assembly protein TadG